MSATYPNAVKSFTPIVDGTDYPQAADINDGYDEITAVQTDLLAAWTAVSFSAGNFTANGSMTWTVASGDQATFAYRKIGKTMTVAFRINETTVGGTPNNELRITIPGGFTALRTMITLCRVIDNSTAEAGFCSVTASTTYIAIQRMDAGNFSAATDATSVQGIITFETTA